MVHILYSFVSFNKKFCRLIYIVFFVYSFIDGGVKRDDSHQMEAQILRPTKTEIKAKGTMYYRNEDHAWNLLRLRKEILNEFKQLKEKLSKFTYTMVFYSDWNEFEKSMKKARREGMPTPVLFWFVKEKSS